jgi:localization factor PodJL
VVSVDPSPTGSIGPSQARIDSRPGSAPTPSEFSAAVPSDLSPSLHDAVLAGSSAAEFELAQRLSEGRGLSQDQVAAAFWFEQAASKGFAPAAFRLGALYQKGIGVQRDPAAAKRWYTAAARSGNARAAHNLGVMDAESVGEKADYAEAAKWFRRAAEMGVRDSQFNLAVLYARGLGVEQDLRQSWVWFSLAAAQGDAEAARKRDEVAERMDPGALAAASDALSKFRVIQPDPTANEAAASSNWSDTTNSPPSAATPASPAGEGSQTTR